MLPNPPEPLDVSDSLSTIVYEIAVVANGCLFIKAGLFVPFPQLLAIDSGLVEIVDRVV